MEVAAPRASIPFRSSGRWRRAGVAKRLGLPGQGFEAVPEGGLMHVHHPVRCSFVPPHILDALAAREAQESADPGPNQRTALVTHQLRAQRVSTRLAEATLAALTPPAPGETDRAIYDDEHTW